MIPVNQFILGGGDPLLYPSEKMTNSIDEQIAFLQSQKQAINEAYRRNAIKKYYLMMLNLMMFMLQLMLNITIIVNYSIVGLVVI